MTIDYHNDKKEFLKLLSFPNQWIEYDMYPDELFLIQKKEFRPEHTRNGAFHWWLCKTLN
jgi:hypothetical protein